MNIKKFYRHVQNWLNPPVKSELEQYIIDNEPKTQVDIDLIVQRFHERERLVQRMRARGEMITSNWIKDHF